MRNSGKLHWGYIAIIISIRISHCSFPFLANINPNDSIISKPLPTIINQTLLDDDDTYEIMKKRGLRKNLTKTQEQ